MRTHGMTKTKFYYKYVNMVERCNNEKADSYKNYGAKGIKCMWETFDDFLADMYNSYYEHSQMYGEENTTLDRIDNDGPYCKENCRWVTYKEQSNNRRNNIILEYKGRRQSLEAWAKELGFTYTALYLRLYRGGDFNKICDEQLAKYV